MTLAQGFHFWIDQVTRFVSPQIIAAEWILVALLALLILLSSVSPYSWLTHASEWFRRVAAHKLTAIAICGILPVILRLSILSLYPVPEPSIHDEFSHLLLADTLIHGRLSNPTHPMWQHFESIHIFQNPTYSSMYPPAQGIFLAAGQMLFHEPWGGVLLSVGIMFAAMCWMLQQWMSQTLAFYGTLIAIARIGVFGPWIDSYLGGAVSAIGGALLIGSIPRLREAPSKAIYSVMFGSGLVILMNSRPFEGAILGIAAFMYILPAQIGYIRSSGWVSSKAAWAPALVLLACGFLFTGYYSYRVTGNALKLPYTVNRDTYGWPENLAFLPTKVVHSRHKVLREMYAIEVQRRSILKKWDSFIDDKARRVFENWAFFIGPLLTVPFIVTLTRFRDSRLRPLLMFIGLIAFLNLFQLVLYPYHLGPVVAVIFAIVAAGLHSTFRLLSRLRSSGGLLLAFFLPVCLLLAGAMKKHADEIGLPLTYWERSTEPHGLARAYIQHWLSLRDRKQLVIVRYAPDHSPNQEWVYNGADIDGSKVVWAREMDAPDNERLLRYFKDREIWLLQADAVPQHVVPYPLTMDTTAEASLSTACRCVEEP